MKLSEYEIVGGVVIVIIVGALLLNLFWANPVSAEFCGNGICSDSEIGSCQIDCDWCGDGYCQAGESCSNCVEDCNSCSASSYCGDGICNVGECGSGCWKDCRFLECENGVCEPEKGENCASTPNDCKCVDGYCDTASGQCVYQSCGNGVCDSGENPVNCPNDCQEQYQAEDTSDINYPIILVHGHSRTSSGSGNSINHFQSFQQQLSNDGYAENKGIVLPKEMNIAEGAWGKINKPVVVRTTYYLNAYDEFGSTVGPEDNHPISVYGNRLNKVVDNVLKYTGKNKVVIISHSMGGLVAREYIKHQGGLNKVDKLITIGTPNHGIFADVANNCEGLLFGRDEASPECDDMKAGSSFLVSLNSGDETLGNVKYMTIRGKAAQGSVNVYGFLYNVCNTEEEYHDEIICVSSVPLNGAINREVNGQEVEGPGVFHNDLIKPSKVLEVYNYVIDFLQD